MPDKKKLDELAGRLNSDPALLKEFMKSPAAVAKRAGIELAPEAAKTLAESVKKASGAVKIRVARNNIIVG